MNGAKWNNGRHACLLHFLVDNGSGVSVDQFAVATYKSHLSKNFEQNRSTLKFQLLIVNLLRLKSICLLRLFVIIVPTLIVIRSSARYVK